MGSYTIKDLEKLSGIHAHTIRIWEKRYNLIMPERTSANIRSYCDDELKKLLNISILNRNGIKISKIATLSDIEINEQISILTEEATDYKSQIENLTIAMIDLDEIRFEKVLSQSILNPSITTLSDHILNPFLSSPGSNDCAHA